MPLASQTAGRVLPNTKANRRGSLMGYVAGDGEFWTWYLELRKETDWKQSKAINITPQQIGFYLDRCLGHSKGREGAGFSAVPAGPDRA